MIEFRQRFRVMAASARGRENLILGRKPRPRGNPFVRW